MKKVLYILALGLMVSLWGTAQAYAITVDGAVGAGEWDLWKMHGTDPNEADIADNYDLKEVFVWWDDAATDVYIRTDVFGTPTLVPQEDPGPAYYRWLVDTSGDEIADFYFQLDLANQDSGNDRIRLYTKVGSIWTPSAFYGSAKLGSVVEANFDKATIKTLGLAPDSDMDVSMYVQLDNGGPDADDRMPNTGWVHTVPEPTSMLLLGVGLIGLAGGKIRKRFMA